MFVGSYAIFGGLETSVVRVSSPPGDRCCGSSAGPLGSSNKVKLDIGRSLRSDIESATGWWFEPSEKY